MLRDADGKLRTPGYQGRFLDSLAAQTESLVCFLHSPRPDESPQMDYTLQGDNIRWVDLGEHVSVPRRMLNTNRIKGLLRLHSAEIDALLIRGPSPLLPALANALDVPLALLLVGDYLGEIAPSQPRWRKTAIHWWARWNQQQQLAAAKQALTFVNSRQLYQELRPFVPNLYETRTTTLTDDDFYRREDTCAAKPIHLLYTGRIAHEKGLTHIVDAAAMLVQQGEDVMLDIVGWEEKNSAVLDTLQQQANALGIGERVVYHGFKSVGEALFEHYRLADVYMICSTKSEGFPRTIWEALAHSLPVVATRVGSIPAFLEDGVTARLVTPKDSTEFAAALASVIHDGVLRRRLISNGFALVQQNTLENRTSELIVQLERYVGAAR